LAGRYDRVYPVNRSIKKKKQTTQSDGGAVEEMMEIWPKPGEISSNLATKLLSMAKTQNQKKSEG
jgi:hypothetical protein